VGRAVEPRREESRRRPQDRVRPAELAVLPFQLRDPGRVDARTPGRWPVSISACMTQLRSVSGLIPSCSPIRLHAPGRDAGSFRASIVNRIDRSRSSSGYFRGATIAHPSKLDDLHQTRCLTDIDHEAGLGQLLLQSGFLLLQLADPGVPGVVARPSPGHRQPGEGAAVAGSTPVHIVGGVQAFPAWTAPFSPSGAAS
jgi:hypothetical protein